MNGQMFQSAEVAENLRAIVADGNASEDLNWVSIPHIRDMFQSGLRDRGTGIERSATHCKRRVARGRRP